jgi:DNA repair exonuclease SbcCD ATPase subunit
LTDSPEETIIISMQNYQNQKGGEKMHKKKFIYSLMILIMGIIMLIGGLNFLVKNNLAKGLIWLFISIGTLIVGINKFKGNMRETELECLQKELMKAEKKELKQKEKRAEIQIIEQQKKKMSELLAVAVDKYRDTTKRITTAENCLNQAESEFKARAFSPFWDQIENAANNIATHQKQIDFINNAAIKYKIELANIEADIPEFKLPKDSLPDAHSTINRMQGIIRKAQKDFQFATIFEQRRTSILLTDGVGTLADVIDALDKTIEYSLSNLTITLKSSTDSLLNTPQEEPEAIQDAPGSGHNNILE